MDHFLEEVVVRRNRAAQEMLFYLANIMMVLFALIGLMGFGMWLLLTSAYSRAQAQNVAAAEYSALIWSAALGYFFFAEIPRWQVWAGAAVVVAAVMMSAWDTRQRRVRGIAD